MGDKKEAAANLKRLAVMFKGIIDLADDLDSLGSMEQAESEAKSRVAKLQADEQAAKDRVAGFDATFDKKRVAAKEAADKLISDADQAKADAEDVAEKILADAQAKAEALVHAAEARVKQTDAATKDAHAALDRLNASILARSAQLDQINKDIAKVRERIG